MAYGVVVSLKQTLEPLLDSAQSRIQIPNPDLKLIYEDLCYLKSFFDKVNSLQDSIRFDELEKQIKDVVQNTQDLIESHISDLFYSGSESSGDESSISEFSQDLLQVKEKLGSFTKMLKADEDCHTEEQQSPGSFAADVAVSSRIDIGRNSKIVGLEDELMMLKQRLFWNHDSLQVILIVGMAGIGKTALAKEVYLDPLTIEHFDIRLFVEIGLEYELKDLLLRLVGQVVSNIEEMKDRTVDELGFCLYRYLLGRRYLVVLDDIWGISAWSKIMVFFPDNGNSSAIIFTTTLTDVGWDGENIIQKRFLNDEEGWDLLRDMAFPDAEECPLELEKIGKTIAENLGGLPLAIVEIGKLLLSTSRVEAWIAVAENLNSRIQETIIPKFLNPSYTQLPQHLKPCFLYLGLFPPSYNIPTSQLIKLWVSEGFIEPVPDRSLEEKAEEFLKDLVSRSLVIVHQRNFVGGIKTCRVHFVLQNLCVCQARQEKICHIVSRGTNSFPEGTKNQRRLGIHTNVVLGSEQVQSLMESVSAARSVLYIGLQHQHPSPVYLGFRWLRVLLALQIGFSKFPDEVLKLVRLRYLAITCHGELPSSISRLWNLEVLIIHRDQRITSTVVLPLEIWKLFKLRHLECMGSHLPDPSNAEMGEGDGCGDFLVLKKLLTLSGVSARSFTEGVLARIPNLRKLGIWLEATDHSVEISCLDGVLTHLRHLESFKCIVMNRGLRSEAASSLISFPSGLRKLSLSGCGFPWEHMMSIGALPRLQVLKLRWCAFCGPEWESVDEHFLRLKFLLLEDLDIAYWAAESSHFPSLEHLLIRRCYKLKEIPSGIGDIPTLEMIEVDDCSISVIISACRIQEEQLDCGNDDLQVRIQSSYDDELKIEKALLINGFTNKKLFY